MSSTSSGKDGSIGNIMTEEIYTVPASFAQQRLWFLDQLNSNTGIYNIPAAIRMSGRLDEAALEKSFNEILRRHETLRTSFVSLDGEPVQLITPHLTIPLKRVDLRPLPRAGREARLTVLINEEAVRPFDLTQAPLFRTTLVQLEENESVLLLTMHHIVCDGWSIDVLIREVTVLYQAFAKGRPSPLPELPIQYADYAVWQREWLQGEALEEQLDYWRRHLAAAP